MKNMQKNMKKSLIQSSEIRKINKLFSQLSDALQIHSLYEAKHLVLVAQTSFDDAICLRHSLDKKMIDS